MDENGRKLVTQHIAEIETETTTLRQIYEALSPGRKKLLEQVLKRQIVCSELLSEVLPSASMRVFMLDFKYCQGKAVAENRENPGRWSPELLQLFASPNMAVLLTPAYLAVRNWNRGKLFAPKRVAMWDKDRHYPVPQDLPEEPTERLSELLALANEPLQLEE